MMRDEIDEAAIRADERRRCAAALCFRCASAMPLVFVPGWEWTHGGVLRETATFGLHCFASGLWPRRDPACTRPNCPAECREGHAIPEETK